MYAENGKIFFNLNTRRWDFVEVFCIIFSFPSVEIGQRVGMSRCLKFAGALKFCPINALFHHTIIF